MRDFPVFSTENGVGSLILKEIPYRNIAYIRIHDASVPELFLRECIDFCRVAGAERIYAAGHTVLEQYPLHTAVWKMSRLCSGLPQTDAALFPVTEKTAEQWAELYNQKMKNVPNSAYMSRKEIQMLLETGDGYFVHKDGALIGLGKASGDRIDAVISMQPGGGKTVVCALCHALSSHTVSLEVASVNHKAVALYESLGFVKNREISRWYRVE